jgi:hypothetical protein
MIAAAALRRKRKEKKRDLEQVFRFRSGCTSGPSTHPFIYLPIYLSICVGIDSVGVGRWVGKCAFGGMQMLFV